MPLYSNHRRRWSRPIRVLSMSRRPHCCRPIAATLVSGAGAARLAGPTPRAHALISVGQESILPNPHQPLGNKCTSRNRAHEFGLRPASLLDASAGSRRHIPSPGKGDLVVLESSPCGACFKCTRCDPHSKVFQHLFRPAEAPGIAIPNLSCTNAGNHCAPGSLVSSGECAPANWIGRLGSRAQGRHVLPPEKTGRGEPMTGKNQLGRQDTHRGAVGGRLGHSADVSECLGGTSNPPRAPHRERWDDLELLPPRLQTIITPILAPMCMGRRPLPPEDFPWRCPTSSDTIAHGCPISAR